MGICQDPVTVKSLSQDKADNEVNTLSLRAAVRQTFLKGTDEKPGRPSTLGLVQNSANSQRCRILFYLNSIWTAKEEHVSFML